LSIVFALAFLALFVRVFVCLFVLYSWQSSQYSQIKREHMTKCSLFHTLTLDFI
jgi:type III secretory pathway component EscS